METKENETRVNGTRVLKFNPEVAIELQEVKKQFDQKKVQLASVFDEQVAKIESNYRKQRDEMDAELFKFKDMQRKQRLELQETYLKARREMIRRKHEAQTSLESERQQACLKVRLEALASGKVQMASASEEDVEE